MAFLKIDVLRFPRRTKEKTRLRMLKILFCNAEIAEININGTRDLTGKDLVKSAFRSERRQVSDTLKSVSKLEAPNFLCWRCLSDLKADFTVSLPVSSLAIAIVSWYS